MENVVSLIEEIQNNIFYYDINQFNKNVQILVEKIIINLSNIDESNLNKINQIFYYMNTALTNKDYLLYGDILQYELKPFIKNV